jgi:hypothetical protein
MKVCLPNIHNITIITSSQPGRKKLLSSHGRTICSHFGASALAHAHVHAEQTGQASTTAYKQPEHHLPTLICDEPWGAGMAIELQF